MQHDRRDVVVQGRSAVLPRLNEAFARLANPSFLEQKKHKTIEKQHKTKENMHKTIEKQHKTIENMHKTIENTHRALLQLFQRQRCLVLERPPKSSHHFLQHLADEEL